MGRDGTGQEGREAVGKGREREERRKKGDSNGGWVEEGRGKRGDEKKRKMRKEGRNRTRNLYLERNFAMLCIDSKLYKCVEMCSRYC